MTQYAVEFLDVVKRFPNPGGGEVTAVDHVTLQIQHGEFFSLLGPSGCGKTTTLRMIAGFEWPTSGDVYIQGQAMGRIPPYLRPANTVFQSYALFQHMSIAQTVAFGLEMEHVSKLEIDRRVGEALDMVQLGGLGKRMPRQLSGGQQQRVALARALVKRPAVLLLDELGRRAQRAGDEQHEGDARRRSRLLLSHRRREAGRRSGLGTRAAPRRSASPMPDLSRPL